MTPAARVSAAIEILDDILDGAVPEKALTGWGRSHRFAGSKDRAAIRDHVFDALRQRASFAWVGGAATGRGIMLGAARIAGTVDDIFNGVGHAPAPVGEHEDARDLDQAPRDVRLDMPDWMLAQFDASLGGQADAVLATLQSRAGVFLRVNLARTTLGEAQQTLEREGIKTQPVPNIEIGLQVTENARRVALSEAYQSGLVELQDTSSQAAIAALNVTKGMRVLDYCAGGGGKALALAALGADVTAHDIDPRRMADIAPRAQRAGVTIATATGDDLARLAPFDLVLCDAPCSGSGTWRRTPAAKWDLTPDRLTELTQMQAEVLDKAAPLVRADGTLAYATCSVLDCENSVQVQSFINRNSGFETMDRLSIIPHSVGDGFFLMKMRARS